MQVSQLHDDKLVVVFKNHPTKNEAKSKEAGRPIFDDMEICEIHIPGSRTTAPVFPAFAMSHKSSEGPFDTEEVPVTYAERFSKQYQQFKAQQSQTISGTPLKEAPFLTPARVAELRALNVYTVEQLALIDGQELKNLGGGGRDLKNAAIDYMQAAKAGAPNKAALEELEQLKARNAVLEEDMQRLKAVQASQQTAEHQFEELNDQQLREYIQAQTGGMPKGDIPRKTLLRMAREATPKVA